MKVAGGIDIWPPLVQRRVDGEPSSVDGLVGAANAIALVVNVNHVGHLQEPKVHAIRIYPERIRVHRVP